MAIPLPSGIIPIRPTTLDDVLYGDRVTEYRWEVLTHADGRDSLAGYLDGVIEPSATLSWSLYAAVKGSGSLKVHDLAAAASGKLRVADVALPSARLRPVLVVEGLPEIPLGVYLFTAAPEAWDETGRVYSLELLDKNTVLDQDRVKGTYTVDAGTPILSAVATVIASAGETINVDAEVTTTLSSDRSWPATTKKLQIVNDLLGALNYSSLWIDGVGNYRATPYLVPADRSLNYELINGTKRRLVDGEKSIYEPAWTRDADFFTVPNEVIAVQASTGDSPALTGRATNENPDSPFSYSARGNRWLTDIVEGVETPDGTPAEIEAFLDAVARRSLIAQSSVQAAIKIKHLPVPLRVSEAATFRNVPAGIDARHIATNITLEAHPLGLMETELQEVVDL